MGPERGTGFDLAARPIIRTYSLTQTLLHLSAEILHQRKKEDDYYFNKSLLLKYGYKGVD